MRRAGSERRWRVGVATRLSIVACGIAIACNSQPRERTAAPNDDTARVSRKPASSDTGIYFAFQVDTAVDVGPRW